MKRVARLLMFLLLVSILLAAVGLFKLNAFLDQPMQLPESGRQVVIQPGATLRGVLDEMQQQGVLGSSIALYGFARATKQIPALRVGEFHLPAGTTPRGLLGLLSTAKPIQYALTLVEGWSFKEMMAAIHANEFLRHDLKELRPEQIMERIGHGGEHPEGRFYPDTYHLERGMSDVEFLRRAYSAMEQTLERLWAERDGGLPFSEPYQALIMASIIEKETGKPSERAAIGGVFVRRLQKGMRLQTDPTVIYGMGDAYTGNIRKKDLQTDTPYNTYTRGGLPPTPICMPGGAAIEAALQPAAGDSLYFVASGDGGHYFSSSLEEHNNAVRKYLLKK